MASLYFSYKCIDNGSRTNCNILFIVKNFQQSNFRNFHPYIFIQIQAHFFGQITIPLLFQNLTIYHYLKIFEIILVFPVP